jgi:hypothetical protein
MGTILESNIIMSDSELGTYLDLKLRLTKVLRDLRRNPVYNASAIDELSQVIDIIDTKVNKLNSTMAD